MIELNIFTNCIESEKRFEIIKETTLSCFDTFKIKPSKIYIDKYPKEKVFEKYKLQLKKYFNCPIIETKGLSDGYIKSIKESKSDYLFQMEHDWIFNKELIKHSLEEIIDVMKKRKIYHFRFSKHTNELRSELMKWQTIMNEKDYNGFKYCETNNMSNNPHIIDRKKYLKDIIQRIKIKPKAEGIEEELTKKDLISCQYGALKYPPTISHLQGRKRK